MERKPSRIQTACWVVALSALVLLAGYVGAYLWRHQQTTLASAELRWPDGSHGSGLRVVFPTRFEDDLFQPAAAIHEWISFASFWTPAVREWMSLTER